MGKEQSKDARVGEIDWSNRKLKEIAHEDISRYLSNVSDYKVLNVSHNELTSLDPIHSLKYLDRVDASRNNLSDYKMSILPKISSLNLGFNKLTKMPSSLNARFLKELVLSNNQITKISSDIQFLESLTFLDLSFNQISELPSEFGTLVTLETLYLNNNLITSEGCKLGELFSLKMIDLSGNKLNKLPDVTFLASIVKLYLNNNQISKISKKISYLPKLKEISLRGNKLKTLPKEIENNVCLQLLDLDDNLFTHQEIFSSNDISLMIKYLYGSESEKKEVISKCKKLSSIHPNTNNSTTNHNPPLANTVHLSISEVGLNRKKIQQQVNDLNKMDVILYTKRLFWIKGTEENLILQKVDVNHKSLNNGDSFILDVGKKLFVWEGGESNAFERAKAEYWASLLAKEQGDIPIIILDAGLCEDSPLLPEGFSFWDELGGKGMILSSDDGGDDEILPFEMKKSTRLFSIIENDSNNRCDIELVSNGLCLSKEMLNSSHCFVLDCFSEIFVWAGMESTGNEKSWALLKAEELERQKNRPLSCTISWILDRDEMLYFKEQFPDWIDLNWISLLKHTKYQQPIEVIDVNEYDKVLTKQMKEENKRIAKGQSYSDNKRKKQETNKNKNKLTKKFTTSKLFNKEKPKEKPEIKKINQNHEENNQIKQINHSNDDMNKSASELVANNQLNKNKDENHDNLSKPNEKEKKKPKKRQIKVPADFDKPIVTEKDIEIERKAKEDADRIAKMKESERKAKERQEKKAKELADREADEKRIKEEAEIQQRKIDEENERKRKEEADKKAKEDADRKAKAEYEKQEKERKQKEEADKKSKEEAERIEKEKANVQLQTQSDAKKSKDAERMAKLRESERRARERQEKKLKEKELQPNDKDLKLEEENKRIEAERKEKERKIKEEADKKAKEEADRKAKAEYEKQEKERKQKEEADKKSKEDAEKQEKERKLKEEADKKAKEEADKKLKEEADKKAKEEAEKQEKERKQKEEADRKAKEDADKKLKEEGEKNEEKSSKKQKKVKIPKIFADSPKILQRNQEKKQKELLEKEKELESKKEENNNENHDKKPTKLARLKGPLKGPSRTARATRNPVKDRIRKEKEDENKRVEPEEQQKTARRNLAAGAYGMLWSLGVDSSLFEKKREERNKEKPKTTKPPHLYHIKGKRRVFIREVEVDIHSLNSGDVFILDNGDRKLYMWNGKQANRIEKGSALDFSKKLKDKYYFGNAEIITLDEGKNDKNYSNFWDLLGEGSIKSSNDGGDDNEAVKLFRDCVKLFKVEKNDENDSGSIELNLVGDGPYPKELLQTTDCFILDCMTEIYPWTGKKANIKLRQLTLKKAQEMANERPFWVAEVDRQLEVCLFLYILIEIFYYEFKIVKTFFFYEYNPFVVHKNKTCKQI